MLLANGFVVAGRYEIRRRIHDGTHWSIYQASTDERGPGDVVVRVLRYDARAGADVIVSQREQADRAWAALLKAAALSPSFSPAPVEAPRMYPGDRGWRSHLLAVDKTLVGTERYYVTAAAEGLPLATYLRQESVDDEHALLLLLRLMLASQSLRQAGLSLSGLSVRDLVVHPVARTFILLDYASLVRGTELPASAELSGLGRIAASLMGGAIAPAWTNGDGQDRTTDWAHWFEARRIPPEYRSILSTLLAGDDPTAERLDASIHRARALLGIRPPTIHPVDSAQAEAERTENYPELGDVRIIDRLAQGGRGTIYRVEDTRTALAHALKVGRYQYDSASEFASELPQRRLELEHEYEILRAFHGELGKVPTPLGLLKAPGVGGWFAIAPDLADGEPHLLMEKLAGVPLLRLLESPRQGYTGGRPSNRLPPTFVLWVIAQLARSLAVIHEAGYLLQDLKTENLIYDPSMELVYLVDLASVCPRDASGRLRRRSVAFGMQTHGFAAPEFGDLWEKVDDRFDIYSLGATAYHLLTGVNPERVAIDEGSEYPTLNLDRLNDLPVRVRELVTRCLEPVERRWPSARELALAADSARLELSRGRPLDVNSPVVEYGAERVVVRWQAPQDRRVTGVIVQDSATGDVVYRGPWVDQIEIDPPGASQLSLEIFSGLIRHGATIRSRGRTVEVQRHPEPLMFEARRAFGAHTVEVLVAAHATGISLRRQREFPPVTAEEGEGVDVSSGGLPNMRLRVPVVGTDSWHYAAFAVYGDVLSAPRFASTDALVALPSLRLDQQSINEQGLRLCWSPPVHGAQLELREVRDDGASNEGFASRIRCDEDGVHVPSSQPGQLVEWTLRVVREGVESAILLHGRARFWPRMPRIEFAAGPSLAVTVVDDLVHLRHVRLEWSVYRDAAQISPIGSSPQTTLLSDAKRIALPVRPAIDDAVASDMVTVDINAVAVLEDGTDGPSLRQRVQCPRPDLAPSLELVDDVAPWRLQVSWPAHDNGYTLRLNRAATAAVFSLDEPESSLDSDTLDSLGAAAFRRVDNEAVELTGQPETPGAAIEFEASLVAPDGTALGSTHARWIHRVRLAAPVATPALGTVQLDALPECTYRDEPVDVEVVSDDSEPVLSQNQIRPFMVQAGQGVRVRARWRLHGDGLMPWSEWVGSVAYRVPRAPEQFKVVVAGRIVLLSWESDEDDEACFEARAPSGRAVYLGTGKLATDYQVEDGEYELRASRNDIHSEWVRGAAEAAQKSELKPQASASVVGTAPRPRVQGSPCLRAIVANGYCVLEIIQQGSAFRGWAAIEAGEEIPRTLDELNLSSQHRVLGAVAGSRRRLLLAWAGTAGDVRLVSWDTASSVGVLVDHGVTTLRHGELVGVSAHRQTRLQLLPITRPLNAPITLQVWLESGGERELELDELEAIRLRGAHDGAVVATAPGALKNVVAMAAAPSMRNVVLVPLHIGSAPDRVVAALFNDAASALPRMLVSALAAALGAPIVSWTGVTSVVAHLLVRGMHTEVQCALVDELTPGRTRVRWRVRAQYGGVIERAYVTHPVGISNPASVVAPLAARLRASLEAHATKNSD
jgi:serine/threonine protein kinase